MNEARVVRVIDTQPTGNGGDPELDVDSEAGTMELADEVGRARWAVSFKLDAPR